MAVEQIKKARRSARLRSRKISREEDGDVPGQHPTQHEQQIVKGDERQFERKRRLDHSQVP